VASCYVETHQASNTYHDVNPSSSSVWLELGVKVVNAEKTTSWSDMTPALTVLFTAIVFCASSCK